MVTVNIIREQPPLPNTPTPPKKQPHTQQKTTPKTKEEPPTITKFEPEENAFLLRKLRYLPKKKPVEPILILMKENNNILIEEGVSEGPYYIDDKKQRDGHKMLMLDTTKLQDMPYYGGGVVKAWIAYENEATAYPTDVKHDSRMLRRIIERLIMNYKDLDTKKTNWKVIMAIGLILIVLFILAQQFGYLDNIMPGAKTAAQTAINNINNTPIPDQTTTIIA